MRRDDATDAAPRSRFDRALAWTAFAVWIAVTAFIAAHHEPWRDEADSWLLARDADPVTFVRRASLAGTPSLWYLILLPFARGGAPYEAQKAIHLVIAAASVALILWRSPFPAITRVAAVFSYFFAYEYAVVARSYALSVLLLLLIATWYRERFTHPYRYAIAIALLANTNTHSLFIAAFLGLFYLKERSADVSSARERTGGPLSIMVIGGLLAVAQLAAAPGERATTHLHIQFGAPVEALGAAFLPRVGWPGAPFAGALTVGVATAWLWKRHRTLVALLWCWYAALALIFIFWWIGGVRHAGLILVPLVAVLWMAMENERKINVPIVLLTITFLAADVTGVQMMRADDRYAYSGAQEMGEFLRASHLDSAVIAAHSETTTSAVAPYVRHPLWYAGIGEFGSFPMWDRKFDAGLNVTYPDAVARARQAFHGRALMLLNVEVPNPAAEGLELVYYDHRPVFEHPDERFWLYRFR
jgi:hypothetical protein